LLGATLQPRSPDKPDKNNARDPREGTKQSSPDYLGHGREQLMAFCEDTNPEKD